MQNCICRFYRTMLTAVLILGSAAQVSAASAPPLTRIAPIELCSEQTGCIPAPEDYPNRVPEGIVFRGENLYVKTRFVGYPAWSTLTYRSATETGHTLGCTELAHAAHRRHPYNHRLRTGRHDPARSARHRGVRPMHHRCRRKQRRTAMRLYPRDSDREARIT